MDGTSGDLERLTPLAYHEEIVHYLKSAEPEVWHWASSGATREQHAQDMRSHLLRETYRLTAETHPQAYDACALAMRRLGIVAPVTLYQERDGAMNAALFYLHGEAHVVLQGPILERLDAPELLAVLGHELAHYRLWSEHDGDFHVADRILNHTVADHGASPSQTEAARLYSLHTEIYADRGAAVAAQSAAPAIATLVKVQTGIANVDPAAYLQQAAELESRQADRSQGQSHPEIYLRAQALERWWGRDPEADSWLHRRLRGPMGMATLDLTDQTRLTGLTRGLLARYLAQESLRSERVMTQVQDYFPDWNHHETPASAEAFGIDSIDDSVRDYLCCVMLDLALADDDLREPALIEASRLADDFLAGEIFLSVLKRDAGMAKRELDKFMRQLAGRQSA